MKKESVLSYRQAVKALDAAVRNARTKHKAAAEKYELAKRTADDASRLSESNIPDKLRKEAAQLAFRQAKEELRPTVTAVWDEYTRTISKVRRELVEALGAADTLRAADVDPQALALLQSGVMRPCDYAQMAKDFSENPAVLAILRREAQKAADAMSDDQYQERVALYDIARNAISSGEQLLASFDSLDSSARLFSGMQDDFRNPAYTASLDAWEELTSGVIPGDGEDGE